MKFRGTYAMALLVAALAGYTFYEYKHASEDLDRAQGERQAFTLKRENIDEIQLTSGGETSVFHKTGDEWKMVKPVEDLAESAAVEGYLFQLLNLKLKTFRSEEEGKTTDWAQYGLQPPRATVELSGNGKKESLSISSKNAFDGSFFVRTGDEALLGDPGLAGIAERQASSLRSRRLWRDEAKVEQFSLELDGGKTKYSGKKEKDIWVITPAPAFPVDNAKVEGWIEKVQDLLPSDFVKEGIEEKDRTEYLLKKPSTVIRLGYKNKEGQDATWELTVGQDKAGDCFLYTNQRPTLYKTGKASIEKLRVPVAYFRDGHVPFQFPVEQAREVRIQTDKLVRSFKKTDSGWELTEPDKDSELDQEKLVQLFQNIRSLEAQEFVDGAKGLKAKPQIQILGEGGKPLYALSWGDEYKAKSPWNTGLSFRYVQTSLGGKNTMGVAKDKLDGLVDSGLVRKKPAEPAKPAANMSSQPEKK